MLANLGGIIEEKVQIIPPVESDLAGFMKLLFEIASHDSLAISVPVVTTWVRIMRKDILSESDAVLPLVPHLLELCTARLLRVGLHNEKKSCRHMLIPVASSTKCFMISRTLHCYTSMRTSTQSQSVTLSWEIIGGFAPASLSQWLEKGPWRHLSSYSAKWMPFWLICTMKNPHFEVSKASATRS